MSARPRVTLKIASSLDGRIATRAGESKWITGEDARAQGHRLRAEHDAIIVGSGTALADDPELTARLEPPAAKQPLRVVLDTRLQLSPTSKLLRTLDKGPVLIFGARDVDRDAVAVLEAPGAEVALTPSGIDGVELKPALAHLKEAKGVETLLVEGGGKLAASFLAADMIDRLEWFRAPVLLGAEGKPAVAGLAHIDALDQALRFRRVAVREIGVDIWESYERL